ncbi:MAG: TIGR00269 family protein [Candidatus Aenigmarchaeota archaeon]|nr:TIGR00269 family protein [Candidatus Aenigmarchaeota archaeon]
MASKRSAIRRAARPPAGAAVPRNQDAPSPCACGKPAIYVRRHEGRAYCRSCFCESLEAKVRKTILKHRLVEKGDRIAVGLSGGKDSSSLLFLLHRFFAKRPDISLVAISVDEGIAGYRSQTLEKAKALCRQLGVEHQIVSFRQGLGKTLDHRLRDAKDSCTYCGVGRRYLLNQAAREAKASKLAVGHNLDDEAQSVLMNFFRGDLLRAGRMGTLAADAAQGGQGFVPRIKPLRFIPERELTLYAVLKGIPYSDAECHYIRGLRPLVRDFLYDLENRYPGTRYAVVESFDKLKPALRALPRQPLRACSRCGEPSSQEVCKACELWPGKRARNRTVPARRSRDSGQVKKQQRTR